MRSFGVGEKIGWPISQPKIRATIYIRTLFSSHCINGARLSLSSFTPKRGTLHEGSRSQPTPPLQLLCRDPRLRSEASPNIGPSYIAAERAAASRNHAPFPPSVRRRRPSYEHRDFSIIIQDRISIPWYGRRHIRTAISANPCDLLLLHPGSAHHDLGSTGSQTFASLPGRRYI